MNPHRENAMLSSGRYLIHSLVILLLGGGLWSACAGWERGSSSGWERQVDSLNLRARQFRYRNLDSTAHFAQKALTHSENYADGRTEAMDNLGFAAIMQMDFDRADSTYRSMHETTRNELHLLAADIGLMKVCQRTAQNKAFYDHKGCAERHIRRIADDIAVFDSAAQARFETLQAEYHIVVSTYYYYLQQEEQSLEAINSIRPEELAKADTATWLYYLYMKGSGGLCEGRTAEETAIREFDFLAGCLQVAERKGFLYFQANSLQGIAALLASPRTGKAVRDNRPVALRLLLPPEEGHPHNDTLPKAIEFAQKALRIFKGYNDIYQIAGTYRTIATCLIEEERYAEAVDTLARSLDYVNRHHSTFYHCGDTTHRLMTYNPKEDYPLELEWTADERVQTVPEWILGIREQLSLAYSGMNLKEASDYNRNIYLDMLEVVRQDKEWESRSEMLEREEHLLDLLLWGTAATLLVGILLFVLLNRRWKRRHTRQTDLLKATLDTCRRVMQGETLPEGETLFDASPDLIGKDEQATLRIIAPYLTWAAENAGHLEALDEETVRMEEERLMYSHRIAANRRENIVKRTCLSIVTGITPFIDRLVHEANRLKRDFGSMTEEEKRERYRYMSELTDKINEYNSLLDGWIKMKQGTLKLHVESFAVEELFGILAKSRQGFEEKGLHFSLTSTDAWVKADKALTLFMLNTLLENARKYTPKGGSVHVSAEERTEEVELIVEDNGPGIPSQDIHRILEEKFYDPAEIGRQSPHYEEIRQKKGHGFGLMNCKGIIEKYRKTGEAFKCCAFFIRQREGGGTRVSFVLPRGLKRALIVLLAFSALSSYAAEEPMDSLWLKEAAYFADQAYFHNVDGEHDSALVCIDSVITCLNRHYLFTTGNTDNLQMLTLTGEGKAAEIRWLSEGVDTDYPIILDIRNEAALAFLALRQWEAYRYNNDAYTRLYKLISRDDSLESYCRELSRSSSDKTVILLLCLLLVAIAGISYYLLYLRRRLSHRFHLQQVFEVNRRIFTSSMDRQLSPSEEDSQAILSRILYTAWEGINDIFTLDTMALVIKSEGTGKSMTVCYPETDELHRLHLLTRMEMFLTEMEKGQEASSSGESILMLPLTAGNGEHRHTIGVMALCRRSGGWDEEEILLTRLLGGFIAIVIHNCIVRPDTRYEQMELLRDEARRAHREEMQLHVQNTVLDNCLSTIKHETLYYPGRIARALHHLEESREEGENTLNDMAELISYYKEVFTLLSTHAIRQCEEVTFRRSAFSADRLSAHFETYFSKAVRNRARQTGKESGEFPTLVKQPFGEEMTVTGDFHALCFLLENLVDETLNYPEGGEVQFCVRRDGRFVQFLLHDTRNTLSQQELNMLFSPEHLKKSSARTTDGRPMTGVGYLICRQIVREHDEYMGHPGCRINAEADREGKGFTIWFTIPGK